MWEIKLPWQLKVNKMRHICFFSICDFVSMETSRRCFEHSDICTIYEVYGFNRDLSIHGVIINSVDRSICSYIRICFCVRWCTPWTKNIFERQRLHRNWYHATLGKMFEICSGLEYLSIYRAGWDLFFCFCFVLLGYCFYLNTQFKSKLLLIKKRNKIFTRHYPIYYIS